MYRPHDLLWGCAAWHLPEDAPAWCRTALEASPPVVVRRAPARDGMVAVGLRGNSRGERLAFWMPLADVSRSLMPEQLRACGDRPRDLPVWHAARQARTVLERIGLAWGITGSAAFELASGQIVTHSGSDLDLLLRTERRLSRTLAQALLQGLHSTACRIDVQLQTPAGGVALAEWAGQAVRVMIKTSEGPRLSADPWEGCP
ncbi:malonate decarboxylase holo-ACP synthase [Stutzerimonas kirkiae]|uniref:malonate decarboxylase holo-ACP synthase n=1 Tax=Stutzerimonas kirkiae TaxID=2211392 RepID=UPI0010385CAC|nr:malonate decarboxylase holo-ACP synthase [Stutzerimonas kirkiae]TBV06864.1 phosphoribosyl-dephospho-CoA transferase [Stutzerimonas kirkiae]